MHFCKNEKSFDMPEIALKIATSMKCFHSAELALSEKYFDFALLLPGGTFCFKIQK